MALRYLDSWDHYTAIAQKWDVGSGPINASAARTGPYGFKVNGYFATKIIDAQGIWIVGVALKADVLKICQIIGTIDVAADQGSVRINPDGTLSLLVGAVVVATSTRTLNINVWYYVELRHVILNAGGTIEVRINGEVWATFGGDTQATANATADRIRIYNTDSYNPCYDDLYILDGNGPAPNNAYWGDTQVNCLLPDGAGFYTNWVTLVGAATHWQATNEVPPNDDTSYVQDNVAATLDSYGYANLPVATGAINGIQWLARLRDSAAAANVQRLYRSGVTDDLAAARAITTAYLYYREIMELDPIAIGAWTVANVNAAEFGLAVA